MNTDLWSIFHDSSITYPGNECIIHYENEEQQCVSYKSMDFEVTNVAECLQKLTDNCTTFGIVGNDLKLSTVVLVLSILKNKCSFMFVFKEDILDVSRLKGLKTTNLSFLITEEKECPFILSLKQNELAVEQICVLVIKDTICYVWRINDRSYTYCTNQFSYAVMSSGSTGFPKVIRVPSRCLIPNIFEFRDMYQMRTNDIVYISSPLSFDPSILDIFLAFSSGASILLTPGSIKMNPLNLYSALFQNIHKVTVIYITPSLFRRWSTDLIKSLTFTTLRVLALGGEPLPPMNIIKQWDILERIKVYNVYGTTEVSCWSLVSYVNVVSGDVVPLGSPLKQTMVEVRDDDGNVVKEGVGEMFLGSDTRVCYVDEENGNELGGIKFRATGDLVQVKNGEYYFMCRKDRIVKIFGTKVDLQNIENAAIDSGFVKCCFCFLQPGQHKVVLIVQLLEGVEQHVIQQLKHKLRTLFRLLLDVVVVSELPVNEHGKTCGHRCKELYKQLAAQCKKKEKMDPKEAFRYLWFKYFVMEERNTFIENSTFLELGGSSILALQLISEMSEISKSVPNNLVTYLLSDKTFHECITLFEDTDSERIGSQTDHASKNMSEDVHLNNALGIGGTATQNEKDHSDSDEVPVTEKFRPSCVKFCWKVNMEQCVDATPLIFHCGGRILVVCGSHSGKFVVLDGKSGSLVSECHLPDRIMSSPCASDNGTCIFVGCYDGNLYALEIFSGKIRWKFKTNGAIKSSPIFFNSLLVFGSYDHFIYCIHQDGHIKWKIDIDNNSVCTSAARYNDLLVVATLGGTLACLSVEGVQKWRQCFKNAVFSSPVISEILRVCLYIDVVGVVRCCCISTGDILWTYSCEANVFSTPVFYHDQLHQAVVLFGCYDSCIYCLKFTNKMISLNWKSKLHSPIYATPFVSCGYVAIASIDGHLYAIDKFDGTVISSNRLQCEVFSSPVICNNYVFFGARDDNLYCFEVL